MAIKDVDVAVIGGGILGSAITYSLSKRGLKVALVEQHEPCSGASGTNLGQISLVDREPSIHLNLARESMDIYDDLEQELSSDFGLQREGGLIFLNNKEQYIFAREIVKRQRRHGLEMELLTAGEVRDLCLMLDPEMVEGGIFCPKEGGVDPLKITLAFQDGAKKLGAAIYVHSPVVGFGLANNKITCVDTPNGKISAQIVVIAAGAWTGELLTKVGIRLPIYFHKGSAMVSIPVPSIFRGPVVSGGFLTGEFIDISMRARVGLAVMQQTNGSIIIGQATEKAVGYDTHVSYDGIRLMAANFTKYFPELSELDILRVWAGITPYTEDGLPVFGFPNQFKNMLIASSFKGAFSTAPAVGEMAADLIITGKTKWDISLFSPDRFLKTG